MTRRLVLSVALILFLRCSGSSQPPEPIIDVHLHASPVKASGPLEPVAADIDEFLPLSDFSGRRGGSIAGLFSGRDTLQGARTDDELTERIIRILRQYNVTAVASGDLATRWKSLEPERIILSAYQTDTAALRTRIASGEARVLGEFGFQYWGLSPTDSLPMAIFSLAEQLGVPVGIHLGPGPPGTPFNSSKAYRARLSSPLGLEEVFLKHPKLRLYVMHAGWPMLDDMLAMLYAYPQLYVDIGVIDWVLPRKEFYRYLRTMVEAGFSKRIMFGSDEMNWPDALPRAIEAVKSASFLSKEQKRDILYNNAVRFLRLEDRAER